MSIRLATILKRNNLTLEATRSMSDEELLELRNFGRKCLRELRAIAPQIAFVRRGKMWIVQHPDDFFECQHGYAHYGDCPLCGRFDSHLIEEIDEYFADLGIEEPDIQDLVAIAEFLEQ